MSIFDPKEPATTHYEITQMFFQGSPIVDVELHSQLITAFDMFSIDELDDVLTSIAKEKLNESRFKLDLLVFYKIQVPGRPWITWIFKHQDIFGYAFDWLEITLIPREK